MKLIVCLMVTFSSFAFASKVENSFLKTIICQGVARYFGIENYSSQDLAFCRNNGNFYVAGKVYNFTGKVSGQSDPMTCYMTLTQNKPSKTPGVAVSRCSPIR